VSSVTVEKRLFGNNKRKQFEMLFQPHLDAAFNLARHLCSNACDAEDIVQEAYMRAYRSFDKYTDNNSRAWILTITRNTCYSWMRRNYMKPDISFDEESVNDYVDVAEQDAVIPRSPEQNVMALCDQQNVKSAIDALSLEFREVIILRELEGFSYREIGQVLDIPDGTVMSRLARARRRLRKLLENDYGKPLL